ncbi:FUSC family protein [Plantactinospora sp. KLBMP9567]|uniref:FUSC family protein n=1 Tax=Plantactinospora sp. KLBMP9567 TaxID=3085900 RepID=UPI00298107AB|nr:FUSC family protein [Plantactinospora sp. KLBMP9567]MDW5329693.1 FUSC family protein [Plantactinospora sp. KLBMP9567]
MLISVQAGLAAGLAAWLSGNVLGNSNPVFAPTAAVGTIVAGIGQRTRRTVELLVGVGLGIAVGDALIIIVGYGPWQTAVIVAMAIGIALGLVGRGGTVVSQVGGTAVLIATLSSSERNLELPRIVDAATGGGVGLLVVALLLPLSPIHIVNGAARPIFQTLETQLRETAASLRTWDANRAARAMETLRALSPDLERLQEAVAGAEEIVTVAPARWGRRQEFEHYARGVKHLVRVVDDAQDLARRATTMVGYREPLPESMIDCVEVLADAVRQLHREARTGRNPEATRRRALEAVHAAGRARSEGVQLFGDAVVAQVRVTASDVVRATGCSIPEANEMVRHAAQEGEAGDWTGDGPDPGRG